MKTLTTAKRKTVFASEMQFGSTSQITLMQDRMSNNRCMECNAPRDSVSDFCRICLDKTYKKTQIGCAFDAWEYYVIQSKPALPGVEAFYGERIGIFERKRTMPELICVCDTFEEAKSLVLKKYHRAGGYTYAACA